MVQIIEQGGDLFGRIGKGLGQGLSEQIPKEVERYRLSSGLKNLEKESANLTPLQQLTRLSSIPGITPQMVQSFGDLAKQQAFSKIFQDQQVSQAQQPREYIPKSEDFTSASPSEAPRSATTKEGVQATLQPFVPPPYQQLVKEAGEIMNKNPGISFDSALGAVQNKYNQEQAISDAMIRKRQLEQDVQSKAEAELSNEIKTLGTNLPGDVLSKIQNKAIEAVRSGKMTEKEASKAFGEEAQDIDRQYQDINALGGVLSQDPKELQTTLKSLSNKFYERGDSRNLAQLLIAQGFSPPLAYAQAMPVSRNKALNKELSSISKFKGAPRRISSPMDIPLAGRDIINQREKNSLDVSKKIAPLLGKDASPMSVSYELEKKGYDPDIWRNYLIDNQQDLDLTVKQVDELSKSRGIFQGAINNLWIKSFSGIEE
jgi:hypothetical protein